MKFTIDLNAPGEPLNPFWNFGANTCHAPLWFREDLQNHLRIVHDELGFKYIRAHGPLSDDMDVVREDGTFNFARIIEAMEFLLSKGLKPFMELSAMPGLFASNDKSVCYYKFRSAPPKDWTKWYELIRDMVQSLVSHFGVEEIRTWYFEIWNEPDIGFWSGTREEYFKLYDLAARAIKETDPALRVGGPATARTNWIDEFLAHVAKPSKDFCLDIARCDFISTHAYPSDVEFLDAAHGEVELVNSNIMRELFAAVRKKVDAVFGPDFPVIIGEWNCSAGPLIDNHDECNNAAYIAKTMIDLMPFCQGSLYWNVSDIYEECNFHYEPFHGGYGILTVNDIRKSAFHAFRMLREHAGEALNASWSEPTEGVGGLVTRDGASLRILLYYYQEPDSKPLESIAVSLAGLPETITEAQLERVIPGHGSAWETYRDIGHPPYLNREILERLEHAAQPKVTTINPLTDAINLLPGTIAQITIDL